MVRRLKAWGLCVALTLATCSGSGCGPAPGTHAAVAGARSCIEYMIDTARVPGPGVGCPRAEHEMQIVERRAGVVVLCRCAGER